MSRPNPRPPRARSTYPSKGLRASAEPTTFARALLRRLTAELLAVAYRRRHGRAPISVGKCRLVTVRQVAAVLEVGLAEAYAMIYRGELESERRGAVTRVPVRSFPRARACSEDVPG
jgi:hypothetical protein